ncbi:MAG TPA: hypothetical protein VFR37_11715 [Longimicrobium sp.]|nr:hypothetical protein [Longimicrobium sp.]
MRAFRSIAAAAALVLVGSGCPLAPGEREERLGIIQVLPGFPAQVGVPGSAAVGEPFVVSVLTHAGRCLRAGPTQVRRDGMTAEVRPYDLYLSGSDCTSDAAYHQHIATLWFDQPGTATVHFTGVGNPGGQILTVTRTVTIE